MHCTNCGKEIEDGVRFCPYCGTETSNRKAVQNEPPEMEPLRSVEKNQGEGKKQISTNRRFIGIAGAILQVVSLFLPMISMSASRGGGLSGNVSFMLMFMSSTVLGAGTLLQIGFAAVPVLSAVFLAVKKFGFALLTTILSILCFAFMLFIYAGLSLSSYNTNIMPGMGLILYAVGIILLFVGRSGRKKI